LQAALESELVMFDFETGSLKAFKETFSKSNIAGCFFYLKTFSDKSRRFQDYGNRADVRLKCKSLLALIVRFVNFSFEILQEKGFLPEMKPITHVGRKMEGVMSSISIWNTFDRL
jgi:hypothetical protein